MHNNILKTAVLDGFVLPGTPDSVACKLHMFVIRQSAQKGLDTLDALYASKNTPLKNIFKVTLDLLSELNELEKLDAFHNPLLYYFIKNCQNEKTGTESSSVLLTGCLFSSIKGSALFMLPGYLIPATGLPFPHLNLLLQKTDLMIAVEKINETVKFTWSDGTTLTVRINSKYNQPYFGDKYIITSHIGPFQYLNYLTNLQNLELPKNSLHYSNYEYTALTEGFELLHEIWPEAANNVSFMYKSIFLLKYNGQYTNSLTNHEIPNAFIASISDKYQAGDAMVHEVSHSRFNDLLQFDTLMLGTDEPTHQSPWRADLRPLSGILNGVHAFLNVCLYYHRLIRSVDKSMVGNAFHEIYETQYKNLIKGWSYLKSKAVPSATGELIFEGLEKEINKL
jgi:hypothetical protein